MRGIVERKRNVIISFLCFLGCSFGDNCPITWFSQRWEAPSMICSRDCKKDTKIYQKCCNWMQGLGLYLALCIDATLVCIDASSSVVSWYMLIILLIKDNTMIIRVLSTSFESFVPISITILVLHASFGHLGIHSGVVRVCQFQEVIRMVV